MGFVIILLAVIIIFGKTALIKTVHNPNGCDTTYVVGLPVSVAGTDTTKGK